MNNTNIQLSKVNCFFDIKKPECHITGKKRIYNFGFKL